MALTIEQSYYLDDSELSDEQRKLLGGDNDTASGKKLLELKW